MTTTYDTEARIRFYEQAIASIDRQRAALAAQTQPASTPQQQWEAAIAAKVAGGMTRYQAMRAVATEQPALYAAVGGGHRPARPRPRR